MRRSRLVVQLIAVVAISMCLGLVSQSAVFAAGECKADVARLCPGAEGPKQELACLKEHKQQLSPQCKKHVLRMLKAAKEAK